MLAPGVVAALVAMACAPPRYVGPASRVLRFVDELPAMRHGDVFIDAVGSDSTWLITQEGPSPFTQLVLPPAKKREVERDLAAIVAVIRARTTDMLQGDSARPSLELGPRRALPPFGVVVAEVPSIVSACEDPAAGASSRVLVPARALAELSMRSVAYTLRDMERLGALDDLDEEDIPQFFPGLRELRRMAAPLELPLVPYEMRSRLRGRYAPDSLDAITALLQRVGKGIHEVDHWSELPVMDTLATLLHPGDLKAVHRWAEAWLAFDVGPLEEMMEGLATMFPIATRFQLEYNRALLFILAHEAYHLWFKPCQASPRIEALADAFATVIYLKSAENSDFRGVFAAMERVGASVTGLESGDSSTVVPNDHSSPSDTTAPTAPASWPRDSDLGDPRMADFFGRPIHEILHAAYAGTYAGSAFHGSLEDRLATIARSTSIDQRALARVIADQFRAAHIVGREQLDLALERFLATERKAP